MVLLKFLFELHVDVASMEIVVELFNIGFGEPHGHHLRRPKFKLVIKAINL